MFAWSFHDMNTASLLFTLYMLALGVVLAVCHRVLQRADPSSAVPPPVPEAPDPYQIAYLRGGANELTRLVIFALVRKGLLQILPDPEGKARTYMECIARTGETPGPLPDVERRAWEWFREPSRAAEIFKSSLPARLEEVCAPARRELEQRKLLLPPQFGVIAGNVRFGGILALLALWTPALLTFMSWEERSRMSMYPMGSAHGCFPYVDWVCLSAVISLVLLLIMCRSCRLSRRGLAYLKRLWIVFVPPRGQTRQHDADLLLLVALLGLQALKPTAYAGLPAMFHTGAGEATCGAACGSCSDCSSCGG